MADLPEQDKTQIDATGPAAVKEQVTTTNADGTEQPVQAEDVLAGDDQATQAKKSVSQRSRTRTSTAFLDILNTPQGQTFTTGLLSVLVVALLFFFAITPAVSSITRQLDINKDLKERNAQYDRKLTSLLTLAGKKQTYASDLETFGTVLGTDTNQDYIYADLIRLSQKHSLDFRSLTFDTEAPQQQKYEVFELSEKVRFQTMIFSVYGNFTNVDKLVAEIEASRRIYDIQSVVVTTDETKPTSITANITINTIYWLIEE